MRLILSALIASVICAAPAYCEPVAEDNLHLEFYTGDWCPPCYRIKDMLKREGQLDALTVPGLGGELRIPIEFVDVPSPSYAERRKRGAADIYGIPAVPQFQLKRGDDMLTAFAFPWDEQRADPAGFKASASLANRLSITLERDAGNGPFGKWPRGQDAPTNGAQPALKTGHD